VKVPKLIQTGWPCSIAECQPGHFILNEELCFKSEYRNEASKPEVFNCAGEYLCVDFEKTIVQPVDIMWGHEEA
jgi:hypothetical protein